MSEIYVEAPCLNAEEIKWLSRTSPKALSLGSPMQSWTLDGKLELCWSVLNDLPDHMTAGFRRRRLSLGMGTMLDTLHMQQ